MQKQIPGGCYLVNGRHVDADGTPIPEHILVEYGIVDPAIREAAGQMAAAGTVDYEGALYTIRRMQEIQRNFAPDSAYQTGMYNGIEAALSSLEDREPVFLDCPADKTEEINHELEFTDGVPLDIDLEDDMPLAEATEAIVVTTHDGHTHYIPAPVEEPQPEPAPEPPAVLKEIQQEVETKKGKKK